MSGRRARAAVARRARRMAAEQRFDRAYCYRDARADDRELARLLRIAALIDLGNVRVRVGR